MFLNLKSYIQRIEKITKNKSYVTFNLTDTALVITIEWTDNKIVKTYEKYIDLLAIELAKYSIEDYTIENLAYHCEGEIIRRNGQ